MIMGFSQLNEYTKEELIRYIESLFCDLPPRAIEMLREIRYELELEGLASNIEEFKNRADKLSKRVPYSLHGHNIPKFLKKAALCTKKRDALIAEHIKGEVNHE